MAPAASRVLDDKPGIDPEASPPRTPPVEFNADRVLPEKVAYASPAVRLFARELGVDLNQVTGSERAGRISKEDVQKYVKGVLAGGVAAPAAAGAPVAAGGGLNRCRGRRWTSASGETEVVQLSRIKKISGANLARNWAMIPPRHPARPRRHHRPGSAARGTEQGEREGRHQADHARLPDEGQRVGAEEVPRFQRLAYASGENLTLKKYFHVGFKKPVKPFPTSPV